MASSSVLLLFLVASLLFTHGTTAFGLSGLWRAMKNRAKSDSSDESICKSQQIPQTSCGILYHKHGCHGWSLLVKPGYNGLSKQKKNDAESIIVRPGCRIKGFDHYGETGSRGKEAVFDARRMSVPIYKDLKGYSDLQKEISAVSCTCLPGVLNPQSVLQVLPAVPAVVQHAAQVGVQPVQPQHHVAAVQHQQPRVEVMPYPPPPHAGMFAPSQQHALAAYQPRLLMKRSAVPSSATHYREAMRRLREGKALRSRLAKILTTYRRLKESKKGDRRMNERGRRL